MQTLRINKARPAASVSVSPTLRISKRQRTVNLSHGSGRLRVAAGTVRLSSGTRTIRIQKAIQKVQARAGGTFPISQGRLLDLIFGAGGALDPGTQANVSITYDDQGNKVLHVSLSDLAGFDTSDLAEADVSTGPLYNQISVEDLQYSLHDERTDIGSVQGSNLLGYYRHDILDKVLDHCVIGWSDREEDGSVRVNGSDLEIYLAGRWRVLLAGVALSQRDSDHALVFAPEDSILTIETHTGDSVETGTNGRPLVQGYQASMGSNPPKEVISGGTF